MGLRHCGNTEGANAELITSLNRLRYVYLK
jgi:hypothetical protein